MHELDVMLGRFADARLSALGETDLECFEALLDVPDQELYRWLTGYSPAPDHHQTPLLVGIIEFHRLP